MVYPDQQKMAAANSVPNLYSNWLSVRKQFSTCSGEYFFRDDCIIKTSVVAVASRSVLLVPANRADVLLIC